MERKSNSLISFILGAAVGAAVGYLLASGKGDEIKEELQATAVKVKDEIDKQVERGKVLVDEIKAKADQSFNKS